MRSERDKAEAWAKTQDTIYEEEYWLVWKTWQAAKADAVHLLKQFIEMHNNPEWRGYPNDYDRGYADCCKAILEIIKAGENK